LVVEQTVTPLCAASPITMTSACTIIARCPSRLDYANAGDCARSVRAQADRSSTDRHCSYHACVHSTWCSAAWSRPWRSDSGIRQRRGSWWRYSACPIELVATYGQNHQRGCAFYDNPRHPKITQPVSASPNPTRSGGSGGRSPPGSSPATFFQPGLCGRRAPMKGGRKRLNYKRGPIVALPDHPNLRHLRELPRTCLRRKQRITLPTHQIAPHLLGLQLA